MYKQYDGRLCGQEAYLAGVTLVYRKWKSVNPQNDHDHCEFCWEKFADYEGCLHEGYSTEDCYRWICADCYQDFKRRFGWRVKQNV